MAAKGAWQIFSPKNNDATQKKKNVKNNCFRTRTKGTQQIENKTIEPQVSTVGVCVFSLGMFPLSPSQIHCPTHLPVGSSAWVK